MFRGVFLAFYFYAVACFGLAGWVYYQSFQSVLADDRSAGGVRLSEAVSRLRGQLGIYKALVNIVAKDPKTIQFMTDYHFPDAQIDLSLFRLTYGAWEMMLIAPDGSRLAVSVPEKSPRLASNALLRAALNGRLGHELAVENELRLARYSRRVVGADNHALGAAIISANLEELEFEWPVIPEPVVFLNREGVTISSNRQYLLLLKRPPERGIKQRPESHLPLDRIQSLSQTQLWSFADREGRRSEVQLLQLDDKRLNMTGMIMLDTTDARATALLSMGLVLALGAALGLAGWIFVQQRRRISLELKQTAMLEQAVEERTAELRSTQNELVEASNLAALGRLSAGISHELNQPLSAILNFAENGKRLLEKSRKNDAADNLGRIAEQVHRITRIIGNLRAFARQEKTAFDRIDLAEVVRHALKLVEAEIENHSVRLLVDVADKPVFVLAGRVRLEQVVLNLVSNALDAMQDTTERILEVRLETFDGNAVLTVSDTGSGVSEPDRVFEPFYTTKELGASKGLGMGLALSHGLVSNFGGTLSCRNLRTGAEFVMSLPLKEEQ